MIVGNEEVAVVFILHLDEVLQRPEIVAQVEVARGAYTAANNIFTHIFLVFYSYNSYSCPTDSECHRERADGHDEKEGKKEVDSTHGHRESTDDKIAIAHTDNAKLLLEETQDKTEHQTSHGGKSTYEQSFGKEGTSQVTTLHTHRAKDENVVSLVDYQQREGRHKAESGDEHDERQNE